MHGVLVPQFRNAGGTSNDQPALDEEVRTAEEVVVAYCKIRISKEHLVVYGRQQTILAVQITAFRDFTL
jgi:hypothetical protein